MGRILLAAVAACALAAPAMAGTTIINLDGRTNTSTDASNAVYQNFAAGTYKVTFTQDQYTAFTRWNSVTGCDSAGMNCRQGWENSAIILLGSDLSDAIYLGDGGATGGYGPVETNAYFKTAEMSLASAARYSARFTLTEAQDVGFFIRDNPVTDNHGGVSLLVASVPEPATWAMLIAGFGLVGLAARRQRPLTVAKVLN